MNDIGFFLNASRETSDNDVISIAQQADSLGYHSFWTGESWGRDAVKPGFRCLKMSAMPSWST